MKNNFQKIPLLTSLIFFIFFCFAFIFLYREINNNNQKAEQNFTTWQIETRRRDDIRTLDRSLKESADDRAQLETHFAKSSDVVPFLDTIEKLAPKAGAKAQVDSVSTMANNTGLLVGLKVTGSFEAVYKFLSLLENSPYELDFLLVDIHKATSWEAIFKIQLLSFVP